MILFEFFVASVAIIFGLELIHSLRVHGRTFTAGFFLSTTLIGYLRELSNSLSSHPPYTFPQTPLTTFGIFPSIPMVWVFVFIHPSETWYLCYEFARKLVPPGEKQIAIASISSGFICIPIETAAIYCQWLVMGGNVTGDVAPEYLLGVWLIIAVVFFYILAVIRKELPLQQLLVPAVLVVTAVISTIAFPLSIPFLQNDLTNYIINIVAISIAIILLTIKNPAIAIVLTTYAITILPADIDPTYMPNDLGVFIGLIVALLTCFILVWVDRHKQTALKSIDHLLLK